MSVFADIVNSDKATGRFRRYKMIFTPQKVSCFCYDGCGFLDQEYQCFCGAAEICIASKNWLCFGCVCCSSMRVTQFWRSRAFTVVGAIDFYVWAISSRDSQHTHLWNVFCRCDIRRMGFLHPSARWWHYQPRIAWILQRLFSGNVQCVYLVCIQVKMCGLWVKR